MSDDWYDDIEEALGEDKLRDLVREVLEIRAAEVRERPIKVRTLTIDFEARTVSVDGRVYGPIPQQAFSIPLLDSTHAIMPTRTTEPW